MDIYKLSDDIQITEKYASYNFVINYEFAEIKNELINDTALLYGSVVTDEKTKKKKSLLTFVKLSDLKLIKEVNVSICDRMKLKLSSDKKYALIQSICDDTSASSYYGESSLYYMDLMLGKFQKITLPEGPIHDFDWTPEG